MANPFLLGADQPAPAAPQTNPFLAPSAPAQAPVNPFISGYSTAGWFQKHITDRLATGLHNLAQSGAGEVAMKSSADIAALNEIDRLEAAGKGDQALLLARDRYGDNPDIALYARSPSDRPAVRAKLQGGLKAGAEGIIEQSQAAQAIPKNPAFTTLAEQVKAKDWLGVMKTLATNPSIFTDTAMESVPQLAAGIALTPLVGPEAGIGVSSFMTEASQDFTDAFQQAGINTEDPKALYTAMQDPKLVEKARQMAVKKGIPVGLFDAISAGLASKAIVPEKIFGKELGKIGHEAANIAAQAPVQAGLGASGEALGQTAEYGRVNDPLGVLLEAVGEFGGAPGEVIGLSTASGRYTSPDYGAPLSEGETARLLRGEGRTPDETPPITPPTASPSPESPTAPPAPTEPSVQEAGKTGEGTIRDQFGINPGVNPAPPVTLDMLPQKPSDLPVMGHPKEMMAQVRQAIAKRNIAATLESQGKTERAVALRAEAQAHLQTAVDQGFTLERVQRQQQAHGPAPTRSNTAQETAQRTPNSPPINVLPPVTQPKTLYRQKLGAPAQGILGPGHYYTLEVPPTANADYEARQTAELRPMQIKSDTQWERLVRAAGGTETDFMRLKPAERVELGRRIRAVVQDRGFDSLVINPDAGGTRLDFNANGDSIRELRKNFGAAPRIVTYDNAKEVPHTLIPQGSLSNTSREGSPFFNLGSFRGQLSKYVRNVDEAALKPNTVTVINEPVEQLAEVNKIKPFVKEFAKRFLKGAKVVVDFDQGGWLAQHAEGKGFAGQFFGTADGTIVLWIDPKLALNDPFMMVQVLAHEFGHAVAWWNWYNTDAATQSAINEAYQEYLVRSAKMRPEEAIAETQNAWLLSSLAVDADINERVLRGESIDANADRLKRWFDFDEWMAEQFVRWATTDQQPLTIVEKYFKSVAEKIKNVFRFFGIDVSKSAAAPVMTAWFRSLQERNAAGLPSSTPFAVMHSQLKGVEQIRSELNEDWGLDGPTPSPATIGMRRLFKATGTQVRVAAEVDKFNWWINKTWGLLQIAAKNPHIQGLRDFVEAVRGFHISKMALVSRADGRLREWRKLGKVMATNLSNFMFDVDSLSYLKPGENARWPTNQELVTLAQKHGLSREALQLYMQIKDDFSHVLDKMQAAWLRDAQASITDPAQLWQAIQQIHAEMGALRSKPYFPHERFGEWTLTARDAAGKTTFFQQFANRRSAVQAAEAYARANPGEDVTTGRLPREVAQFRGLPPTLMRNLAGRLNLTAQQQRQLEDLILDLSPANSAAKRFKKRTGTPGYSMDGMRAYAHYFSTMSGWLARLEYSGAMRDGIKWVQQSARIMRGIYAADAVHKRLGIAEWMQRTFDYLNDGKSEWQGLRSFAFLWYLGYNISSAMINLMQVPMVALPYLSGRFGDLQAMNELRKAYGNVRGNYLMRSTGHTPELQAALDEAVKQGFIDESMASELASAASGGTLLSMLPGTKLQRGLMRFANIGAVPFQLIEKLNRRVVFQAMFRLAQGKPNAGYLAELERANPEQFRALQAQGWTDVNARAFLAARDAIERTQFEYAKWARPEFMRGKASVLFTFFMFKQNMLWFLKNSKGAGRAWVMLLLAAGVMGLPGADALDALVKFLAKHLGGKYFDPQLELRKLLVEQLHTDPDLVMHGLGYHTLGMSILGDALGIPVPDVDLSSRLGMQQLIPGVEPMLAINKDSWDERFGKSAQEVLGAGVNVPLGILKAVSTQDPNSFKQIERGLPTAFKNFARAYRWLDQGAETTRSGADIQTFDILDSRSRMEVFAQALGFTPTSIAAKRELSQAEHEAAMYWSLRRSELFEQFAFARMSGDKEAIGDAREAIREYNATAPNGKLKITLEDLKANLKSRLKSNAKIERGLAPTQGLTPVYRGLQPLYPGASAPRQ